MGFATKLKIVAELNQASLIIVPLHNQRNMVADAIKLEKLIYYPKMSKNLRNKFLLMSYVALSFKSRNLTSYLLQNKNM